MKRYFGALGALLLGGCSTYEGSRLDPNGSLPPSAGGGVPFTMTRPEFVVKKVEGSDPEQYQVSVTYVPDPMQRYSIRLSPALLSNVDFSLGFGENGGLTSSSADVKDQVAPTVLALFKVAASAATAFGSGGFLSLDQTAGMQGCFATLEPSYDASRAKCVLDFLAAPAQDGVVRPDTDCRVAATGAAISARLSRHIGDKGKDKGQPLKTLFARNDDEKECFVDAADALRTHLTSQDGPKGSEISDAFEQSLGTAGVRPEVIAEAAKYHRAAVQKGDVAALKRLGYTARTAAAGRNPAALQKLLPSSPPPSVQEAAAIEAALKGGFLDKNKGEADRVAQIGAVAALTQAFDSATKLEAPAWRARYLAALQAETSEAEQKVLAADPSANAKLDPAVVDLRRQMAAMANVKAEFERLREFEKRLDTLPSPSDGQRLSPAAEYEGLRKQKTELEQAVNTAVAAALTAESKPKKPDQLPLRVPWVSAACIDKAKEEAWRYSEGADSPEFVVVLRRAASNEALTPPDYEDGKCGAL